MSINAIRADLDRHMQVEIGKVVTRHLDLARMALEPGDCVLLLINAAIGLAVSSAASAGHLADEERREQVIAETLRAITKAITSDTALLKIRNAAATGIGDIQ